MALTRIDKTGDGTTTVYDVSFALGFLKREDIYVSLDSSEFINQLTYSWLNDTQIVLDAPVSSGVPFNIRRVVDRNLPINDYTEGAILREQNLDDSFAQTLMILQEIEDGYFIVGESPQLANDLDMKLNQIKNLGEGTLGSDAVTLQQVTDMLAEGGFSAVIPVVQPRQVGDGTTTVFATPSNKVISAPAFFVNLDGVSQRPITDYSIDSNGNCVFVEPPLKGVTIDITFFTPIAIDIPDAYDARVITFATLAEAVASTDPLKIFYDTGTGKGAVLQIADRANSTWDVVLASSVTPNTFDIVQSSGFANLALKHRVVNGEVSIIEVGGICDDINDDTLAVNRWNDICRSGTYDMIVPKDAIVNYSNTLDLTAAPSSFVFATPVGVSIKCYGELHYTGTDKAVNFTGNLVGVTSFIESMRGAGRLSGDTIVGGGNESIGVYIGPNSGNIIQVNRVTDFRSGIVLDGCYNNTVNYGSVYANDIGITFRGSAALGYGCIANTVKGNLSGGPYTSVTETPERIDRCNRIGVWLQDAARGNEYQGNTEYSIGSAGGIGLLCEGDRNKVRCYGEGHSLGMRSFKISGNQNELELGGGDALNADIAALEITGKDNNLSMPQNRQSGTTLSTFAPHAGQTEYDIDDTTTFNTLNKEFKQSGIYTSNWNMLSGVIFNALAPLTSTSSVNDRPSTFPITRTCYEVTSSDNVTRWFDSNTTDVLDAATGKVLISVWLKAVTNTPKISIIVRDAATGDGLDSFNTALTTSGWKKVQFLADTGGATNLKLRIASRSFDGTTGFVYRVFNPYISQQLDAPEPKSVDSNYPLPAKEVSGYNHFIDVQRFDSQCSYDSHSTDTFATNLLDVKSKPVIILTGNTGGNTINAISNMNDNSTIEIINAHTAAISLTTTLGEWTSNISLTNGRSIKIHKRNGLYYAGI